MYASCPLDQPCSRLGGIYAMSIGTPILFYAKPHDIVSINCKNIASNLHSNSHYLNDLNDLCASGDMAGLAEGPPAFRPLSRPRRPWALGVLAQKAQM
jgi:hypothetical protein